MDKPTKTQWVTEDKRQQSERTKILRSGIIIIKL